MQGIVRLQRLANRFHENGVPLLPRALEIVIRLVFGAALPAAAKLAPSTFLGHGGLGVVINAASVIGERCNIDVHVVLGGRDGGSGAPVLEDDVIVSAGAKLIGPIRIGRGSLVAANAVVLSDVPPASMVAGVPAIVKRSNIDIKSYMTESERARRR